MYLITPLTETAKDWISDNVQTEPWQWLRGNLAIDHHYIEDLVDGMIKAGLTAKDFIVEHC